MRDQQSEICGVQNHVCTYLQLRLFESVNKSVCLIWNATIQMECNLTAWLHNIPKNLTPFTEDVWKWPMFEKIQWYPLWYVFSLWRKWHFTVIFTRHLSKLKKKSLFSPIIISFFDVKKDHNFIFWCKKRVVSTNNGVTSLFWRPKHHFFQNHTQIRELLRKWTFSTTKNAITWNEK